MRTTLGFVAVFAGAAGAAHGLLGHYDHGAWFLAAACWLWLLRKGLEV